MGLEDVTCCAASEIAQATAKADSAPLGPEKHSEALGGQAVNGCGSDFYVFDDERQVPILRAAMR